VLDFSKNGNPRTKMENGGCPHQDLVSKNGNPRTKMENGDALTKIWIGKAPLNSLGEL